MPRPVALVTGASRGIGAETAVLLARDGFDVALAARSADDLEKVAARCAELGAATLALPTDVTDEEQVRAMITRTAAEMGGLQALVNNAGGNTFMSPLTEMRPTGFDKIFRLNVSSVFWALQEAGKVMAGQGGGSVINIASVAGATASPGMAHYGAAKAAVIHLTRSAAMEWGRAGIRVNAVAPGWIKTDLSRFLWENPEAEKAAVAGSALGRWGDATEIAELIAFLAGPKSSYLTGQTILADGGLALLSSSR